MSYYAEVLGFSELFSFGSPLVYAGMQRDGVQPIDELANS